MTRAAAFCREILPQVSRTFALSIRVLPGDLGNTVRTSYLLCRIADTIEDEPQLSAEQKAEWFDVLRACFDCPDAAAEFAERAPALTGDPATFALRVARTSSSRSTARCRTTPEVRSGIGSTR